MAEEKLWYWHISIDTTKAALERLARALLKTDSGLEGGKLSRIMPRFKFGRGISAHLVVKVPEGQEDMFREIARPIAMRAPPQPYVGTERPPHDGHPGRKA